MLDRTLFTLVSLISVESLSVEVIHSYGLGKFRA